MNVWPLLIHIIILDSIRLNTIKTNLNVYILNVCNIVSYVA